MAQLPRYQETGLVSGDIPRLDFANVREQAQGMQSISGSLDRIAQFALGKAQKEFEKENELTAIQARTELEGIVQKRMAELSVKVETNQITSFNEIQTEIQAMSGLADGLKDLSIDQANGLISSIRTSGKALLAKSSDIMVKNYQAGLKVQVRDMTDSFETNLQTFLDVSQDPAEFALAKGEARNRVYARAIQAGNADEAMKAFDEAADRARNSAMAKYFLSPEFATKPSDAIAKLSSKDAGKFSAIWNQMTSQDQTKVVDRILKQSADLYSQQEREKKLKADENKKIGLDVRQDLYMGKITPQVAVQRLRAVDDITGSEMKSILAGDEADGNPEIYGRFESLVDRGVMGENAIDAYATSGTISWKQANTLKKLARGADKDFSNGIKLIDSSLGVPDPLTPGFRNERKLAADAKALFIKRRDDALQAGEPFDPISQATAAVATIRGSNDFRMLEEDKKRLRDLLERAGIKYDDNLTLDALRRMKPYNDLTKRQRKTIEDLLSSVRG